MSNTNYRAYLKATLDLARSMIIKSVAIEQKLNENEQALGYEVLNDPTTWTYYKHLSGEYTDDDKLMVVTSFDTSTDIEFTVERLNHHPSTRKHYEMGSDHYTALVARYPDQEFLIRGILQPVNKNDAIEANDFQILAYDESLVEVNEVGLINHLQKQLNEFRVRWDNPAYNLTDELYSTASLAVLYGRLPGWILNHRLSCCKTEQVHSFHMREYLKSHGRLDRQFPYLNLEQKLWLYRNILYIERNAGKQHTFDWISHHLLTRRGLGFGEYTLQHNLDNMPEGQLKPTPEGFLNPLNAYYRHDQKQENSIQELLIKQRPLTLGNEREELKVLNDDYGSMQHSRRARLKTKTLESATIDWSESGPFYRSRFLLNHWLYCSINGDYNTRITIRHPRDNRAITLSTEEAFILFLYAYNRSNGIILNAIPRLTAQTIRRYPTPNVEDLASLVELNSIDPHTNDQLHPSDVEFVANQPYVPVKMNTTEQFIKTVTEYYETFVEQSHFYGTEEQFFRRAQKQALMDHLYMDVDVAFHSTGQSYIHWLSAIGFYPIDLKSNEYSEIADALLVEATGFGLQGDSQLAMVQKAMLDIMRQLSSYSVHFVQSINYGPILFWEWPAFRPGRFEVQGQSGLLAKLISLIPTDAGYRGQIGYHHNINRVHHQHYTLKGFLHIPVTLSKVRTTKDKNTDFLRLPLARTYFHQCEMSENSI